MRLLKNIFAVFAALSFTMTGQAVQIRKENGHRIPEYILPTDRDNPALWTPAPYLMQTRGVAPGGYATKDIPRTGTIEYPLILVDFIDRPFSIADTLALLERYERIFNKQDCNDTVTYIHKGNTYHVTTGSVSDYFRDQSYGQFVPKFKIIGPVHPSKGYAYYGKEDDYNVSILLREICQLVTEKGLIDLSGYARNGKIDQLSIIYAGRGENYLDSDPNTIWPNTNYLDIDRRNDPVLYQLGIKTIKYVCSCELFWDSDSIPDGIGSFCHEFSHTLGLPDFYNTISLSDTEKDAAMGFWSIMDYGSYENGGFSPVGYTAFEKYSLGWMDLEEIVSSGYYSLDPISCKPDPDTGIHLAYRLNTGYDDQFIILENHTRTGWYKYHASEGLMVTAVNYDNNKWVGNTVNNNKSNKRYCILPADNNYDRYTNSGDLFPYYEKDSITTLGNPQLKAGSSYPSFSIYNIQFENGIVAFHASPDMSSGVNGLKEQSITISTIDDALSITAPTGSIVTIHDISGKTVFETVTTKPTQQIDLTSGIWIVKCGNKTRKVRL